MHFFCVYKYIYMFLIKEKPEMDDLKKIRNFGSKGKILSIFKENIAKNVVVMDTLAKISLNIFSWCSISMMSI